MGEDPAVEGRGGSGGPLGAVGSGYLRKRSLQWTVQKNPKHALNLRVVCAFVTKRFVGSTKMFLEQLWWTARSCLLIDRILAPSEGGSSGKRL